MPIINGIKTNGVFFESETDSLDFQGTVFFTRRIETFPEVGIQLPRREFFMKVDFYRRNPLAPNFRHNELPLTQKFSAWRCFQTNGVAPNCMVTYYSRGNQKKVLKKKKEKPLRLCFRLDHAYQNINTKGCEYSDLMHLKASRD